MVWLVELVPLFRLARTEGDTESAMLYEFSFWCMFRIPSEGLTLTTVGAIGYSPRQLMGHTRLLRL